MPHRRKYDRTPDALGLLALGFIAGLAQLLTGEYPASVMDLVPWPWAMVWSISLTGSALVALIGIVWPRHAGIGWALELAGRAGLACTAGAYAYAFGLTIDTSGALLFAFVLALSLASLVRVVQLAKRLRSSFLTLERRIMAA